MKSNRCAWLTCIGILLLAVTIACKKLFPATLGHSTPLIWGCGVVASALFALSLFLSLQALFSRAPKPEKFACGILLNLFCMLGLLTSYFAFYVILTKVYYFPATIPSMLPKLVENARTANSEAKRLSMAKYAYEVYEVRLTYRKEDGSYVEYAPSPKEIAQRAQADNSVAQSTELQRIIQGQLKQYPYIFVLDVGSFFLTFSIATIWYVLRKPKDMAGPSLRSG